jgi:hypothetical protein
MFPTVEVSVIELVLETCGGSTDRSIEQLLSMTDDNFKPDELTSVRREEAVRNLVLIFCLVKGANGIGASGSR